MLWVTALREEIQARFNQYFSSEDHFILAISGGLDSMVLLDIVAALSPERCSVVTIDHHLRPNSKNDTELVLQFCEQKSIECIVEQIDIPQLVNNGYSVEEIARRERYLIFERLRKQKNAKAVVTAHHAQDQIETQIMHLIRGCDLPGLIGMPVLNANRIFRPLLDQSKAKLKQYAEECKLLWHEDETNQDTRYFRNHIRHHWVVKLQKQLPVISSQASLLDQEITNSIKIWVNQHGIPTAAFTRSTFYQLAFYLRLVWIHQLLVQHFHLEDVTASWVGQVYHWFETAKSGSKYTYKDQTLMTYHNKKFRVL